MHLDAVKAQLVGGYRLTCALHVTEVGAVDWRWRNMRPYGDPIVSEHKEPFDVAFSGEKPVILLGLPDLTLLRR